jgi:hypothetical protein
MTAWYRDDAVRWFRSLPASEQRVVRILGEAMMARWPSPDDVPDVSDAELLRAVLTPALLAEIARVP